MFKTLTKISCFIFALILTFFVPFCNYLKLNNSLSIKESFILGDRGGSHLPDVGINLTLEPWLIILLVLICIACIVLICILVHHKHSYAKKLMEQMNNQENSNNGQTTLNSQNIENVESNKAEQDIDESKIN